MNQTGDLRLTTLLGDIASKTPAPGGGAVASITGATAASLAGMVVAYSLGKKKLAEHQPLLETAHARLAEMSAEFLLLADEDAKAYSALNELQRLPEGDARRATEEPAAINLSVDVPGRVLALSLELLRLVESLVGNSNSYLRSDLAISAVLAGAAAAAAGWNVRINAPLLPEDERALLLERLEVSLAEARSGRDGVEQACV